jgi:hypothetical protein
MINLTMRIRGTGCHNSGIIIVPGHRKRRNKGEKKSCQGRFEVRQQMQATQRKPGTGQQQWAIQGDQTRQRY